MFFDRYYTRPSYYDIGDGYLYMSSPLQQSMLEQQQQHQIRKKQQLQRQQQQQKLQQQQDSLKEQQQRGVNRGQVQNECINDRKEDTQRLYHLVRDQFGNVYYVQSPKSESFQPKGLNFDNSSTSGSHQTSIPVTVVHHKKVSNNDSSEKTKITSNTQKNTNKNYQEIKIESNINMADAVLNQQRTHTSSSYFQNQMNKNHEKNRIIVEDASDSESDNESSNTKLWRNRIPSPGQWMEPVEYFQ